jgi:DNA polymerase-3 subunit delta
MGALSLDALFRSLKKGALDPAYYLYGDEDVLKQEALQAILGRALAADARDFNLDQRDADGLDAEALHALVNTPPMLAERRVVVLRAVEQLRKKSRARDELLRYLAAPSPSTVLVLVQGNADDAEADLAKVATVVRLERLPPDRVRRWVDRRAGQLGTAIDPDATDLLVTAVDGDLGTAARELEKLAALASGRAISATDVSIVSGVQRGRTVTDLVDAVLTREPARAAALVGPVLEQAGTSGVRVVSAIGTALLGAALARAELDRAGTDGAARGRLADLVYRHLESARPPGLGSWRATAAAWAAAAARWTAPELRRALRLALAADRALKTSTVRDERAIVLDLVLGLAVAVEVAA